MKLLPEVPTKDLLNYLRVCRGGITCTEFPPNCPKCGDTAEHTYANLYATAPDVNDEHCGWCRLVQCDGFKTTFKTCDSDALGAFKVYRHQSPRIAALEAEVVKLQAQLAKARSDALEESAGICDGVEDDYHKRERMKFPEMKTDAEACARECAHAIRAAKGKP